MSRFVDWILQLLYSSFVIMGLLHIHIGPHLHVYCKQDGKSGGVIKMLIGGLKKRGAANAGKGGVEMKAMGKQQKNIEEPKEKSVSSEDSASTSSSEKSPRETGSVVEESETESVVEESETESVVEESGTESVVEESEDEDDESVEETVDDMEKEAVDLQNDDDTPQQASEATDTEEISNVASSGVNTPIQVSATQTKPQD
jgi:hypothetical protein